MPGNFRVSGAFFENKKDTGPAFSGFVEIDGVRTNITLWPKTSKAGQNYLQISEDKKPKIPSGGSQSGSPFKPRQTPATPKKTWPDDDDGGDSIPF
jgi:hypothetical protein